MLIRAIHPDIGSEIHFGFVSNKLARRKHFPPKGHVTRSFTLNFSLSFYNVSLSFSESDIDGDGLVGLVEKGGSSLATKLIPNVGHQLKIIRKINYLARHQEDGNM